MTTQEFPIARAVTSAAAELLTYGTETDVTEWADMAWDRLPEYTCYLTPEGESDVYATIVREVLDRAGLPSGTVDTTRIARSTLFTVVKVG